MMPQEFVPQYFFLCYRPFISFKKNFLHLSSFSKRRGRPRKHPLPPRPSLPSPSSSSSSSTSSGSSSSGSSSSSSEDEDDEDEEEEEPASGAVEPCAALRCKLPQQDTVQWIQCDVCDAWYHIDCLHVDRKKLLKDPNADFYCGCRWQEATTFVTVKWHLHCEVVSRSHIFPLNVYFLYLHMEICSLFSEDRRLLLTAPESLCSNTQCFSLTSTAAGEGG